MGTLCTCRKGCICWSKHCESQMGHYQHALHQCLCCGALWKASLLVQSLHDFMQSCITELVSPPFPDFSVSGISALKRKVSCHLEILHPWKVILHLHQDGLKSSFGSYYRCINPAISHCLRNKTNQCLVQMARVGMFLHAK